VDTLDRLVTRGRLQRLYLPGTRLIRFDVADLDRLVEESRSRC
jgi:hypothetical protein